MRKSTLDCQVCIWSITKGSLCRVQEFVLFIIVLDENAIFLLTHFVQNDLRMVEWCSVSVEFFFFFFPPVGTCKVIWQREVDYDYKNVIYIHFKDLFWTHNKRKRYKVISVEKVESGGITIMCLLLLLWFQNESLKWIQIILFLIMQVTRVM